MVRLQTNRITLRIPIEILEPLKEESENRDLPLNAVINRILTKNIAYDNKMSVLSTVIIPKSLQTRVFENLSEQQKLEIANEGPKIVSRLFSFHNLEPTLKNLIQEYFVIVSKYCNWYEFHQETHLKKCRLVFDSHLGKSWTSFLYMYIKSILNSFNITIVEESKKTNMIIFEVLET